MRYEVVLGDEVLDGFDWAAIESVVDELLIWVSEQLAKAGAGD
jgi:hypothetical protein